LVFLVGLIHDNNPVAHFLIEAGVRKIWKSTILVGAAAVLTTSGCGQPLHQRGSKTYREGIKGFLTTRSGGKILLTRSECAELSEAYGSVYEGVAAAVAVAVAESEEEDDE
jgi:hypothetical protein